MRTTFFQTCLFDDDLSKHESSLIFNGKQWGVSKAEREREREESERWSVGEKGCGIGS
jgi:hypothetical protein